MKKSEEIMTEKAVAAMKAAVSSVVKEHRRRNVPLASWKDGKVVYHDPHNRQIVREDSVQYGQEDRANLRQHMERIKARFEK